MCLSTGSPIHGEPLQVPRPEMVDIRAELKTDGHLAAVIFTGVPGEEEDPTPRGYSTVVTMYSVKTGKIVTVRRTQPLLIGCWYE